MDPAELRLLSLLLGAPEESALEAINEAGAHHGWLGEAIDELARLPLDQWQGEHTRLFIAGYPRTPCPPFASSWLEKRMHGGPMEALLLFYARLGLESTDMPADYLGVILECAALLAEDPDSASLETALWREHLLPWLPDFTAELAKESRLFVYRALAQRLDDVSDEFRMAIAATGAA